MEMRKRSSTSRPGQTSTTRRKRVLSSSNATVELLCSLTELELVEKFLKPLLVELGFEQVDDNGGPGELGRDLICWKKNPFGRKEVAVAQVKRVQPSARASDKGGFPEIVTQLGQALEQDVYSTDGLAYRPSEAYFITPYCIDVRALESRFEGLAALRSRRVSVIDGHELAQLIRQKLPHLLVPDGTTLQDLRQLLSQSLDNEPLLRALHSRRQMDIDSLYSDLAFVVCKRSETVLLEPLDPHSEEFTLSYDDLQEVRRLDAACESRLNARLLQSSATEIDVSLKEARNQRSQAVALERSLAQAVDRARQPLDSFYDLIQAYHVETRQLVQSRIAEAGSLRIELDKQKKLARKTREAALEGIGTEGDVIEATRKVAALQRRLDDASKHKLFEVESFLWTLLTLLEGGLKDTSVTANLRVRLDSLLNAHEDSVIYCDAHLQGDQALREYVDLFCSSHAEFQAALTAKRAAPPVSDLAVLIKLDGGNVARAMHAFREDVAARIQNINNGTDDAAIDSVLRDIHGYTSELGPLFLNKYIRGVLCGGDISPQRARQMEALERRFRITVPLHKVFATGQCVLVLGEAGAGKTTTLQTFARLGSDGAPGEAVTRLFFPLGQAARAWEVAVGSRHEPPDELVSLLGVYVRSVGSRATDNDMRSILIHSSVTLVLDAVDEAAAFAGNMGALLQRFTSDYPAVQVIVSSRDIEEYVAGLPFAAVRLLEFTTRQRNGFVRRWFRESPMTARRVIGHIRRNANFGDTIRNPLQATVLCVLAENDVTLPESEWKLYEARVGLLTGRYDTVKGISQRILTRGEDLERVAKGVAYRMHLKQTREGTREQLAAMALDHFPVAMSRETCIQAIDELVCPCNILMPMNRLGGVGFGHLRYQEFLAACEVRENRTTDLARILCSPWWTGVCILLAGMDFDLDWLQEYVTRENLEAAARQTLIAMWQTRGLEFPSELAIGIDRREAIGNTSEWDEDASVWDDE